MSRKTSPARRAAFLAALRASGNQTLAAERARVSRSWVTLHRASDAAFDGAVREAVAEAKRKLKTDPHPASPASGRGEKSASPASGRGERSSRPPPNWAYLDGEELVVRGTNGVRVQIARARLRQWTPRVEERFLAALAGSCNVKLACAEAGLSVPSAYRHRERWPGFAARWDAAISVGYDKLDQELVTCALRLLDPEVRAAHDWTDAPIPPMTVDQAIQLTGLHLRRARKPGKWPGVR